MDKKQERLEDFIEIDIGMANRLFQYYEPKKKVTEFKLLEGGRSNTNYKLKVNDQYYVLRIYSISDKRCLIEHKIANKFRNKIPVPDMYYLNNKKRLLKKDFAIIELMEGEPLDQYIAAGNQVSDDIFEQLGHILAYIHKDKYKIEGFLDENLRLIGGLPSILEWYHHFLSQKAGERLEKELIYKIYEIIDVKYEQLEEAFFSSVLCHGDFGTGNILVKDNKVTGILDWEYTLAAPIYYDIGQLFRYDEHFTASNEASFINAYNSSADSVLHENWKKLAKIMDLANCLCFLNNDDDSIEDIYNDMRRLIRKTVDMLEEDLE